MAKYRTQTQDAPEPIKPKVVKPGRVGDGKIGVYDSRGRLRGQVGPNATSFGVARFHKQLGSTLGTKDGRPAWLAPTLADVSAQGSATPGSTADTLAGRSSRGATATTIRATS